MDVVQTVTFTMRNTQVRSYNSYHTVSLRKKTQSNQPKGTNKNSLISAVATYYGIRFMQIDSEKLIRSSSHEIVIEFSLLIAFMIWHMVFLSLWSACTQTFVVHGTYSVAVYRDVYLQVGVHRLAWKSDRIKLVKSQIRRCHKTK